MTIESVLVPVPTDKQLRTPQHVELQRKCARLALRECARRCGAPPTGWAKDAGEVPQPHQGWHWSVSHKRQWACAAIADQPVGIDLEHVIARPEQAFEETGSEDEWGLFPERSRQAFFRLWTAKEAVLKALGIGIAGMPACRLTAVPDDRHLTLAYRSQEWTVEHCYHCDHIASVTCRDSPVSWQVIDVGADAITRGET